MVRRRVILAGHRSVGVHRGAVLEGSASEWDGGCRSREGTAWPGTVGEQVVALARAKVVPVWVLEGWAEEVGGCTQLWGTVPRTSL